MTVPEFLTLSGSSVAFTCLVLWLLRNWITMRLKESIKHEYDRKLAEYTVDLNAKQDVAIEKLRADIAKEHAVQSVAQNLLGSSHSASQERRLSAIEAVWHAAMNLRNNIPVVVFYTGDLLTAGEYKRFPSNETHRELLSEVDSRVLTRLLEETSDLVEAARPFFGEGLYSVFFAYRAFLGRCFHLLEEKKNGKDVGYWLDDSGVQQILRSVFTEQELRSFKERGLGPIYWVLAGLERLMLSEMRETVSGKASGKLGLEQARKISEAAEAVMGAIPRTCDEEGRSTRAALGAE